ncbi:MAG: hypothetical protein LBV58_04995 [Acholeplasmatales bacterium]|jgi:ATP-dependent Zn protease|nr:hypothetical protein [Acholeplasmatales bacterium]
MKCEYCGSSVKNSEKLSKCPFCGANLKIVENQVVNNISNQINNLSEKLGANLNNFVQNNSDHKPSNEKKIKINVPFLIVSLFFPPLLFFYFIYIIVQFSKNK